MSHKASSSDVDNGGPETQYKGTAKSHSVWSTESIYVSVVSTGLTSK